MIVYKVCGSPLTPRFRYSYPPPRLGIVCAVCSESYAPGFAFTCQKCHGVDERSIWGLTVVLFAGPLILAAVGFSHLWSVINVGGHEEAESADSIWRQRRRSCRTYLVRMLPLSEVKIIVTVWQIITQVSSNTVRPGGKLVTVP